MLIESLAAPFLVALLAAGIGRSLGYFKRMWPSLAIMAGFFTAYVLGLGTPPWPPRSASQKLPYVMLFGTLLGTVAVRPVVGRIIATVWPFLIVLWLGWRPLVAGDGSTVLLILALGAVGMIICAPHPVERGTRHLTMLTVAAFGLACLAVLGKSLSLGQLAVALAAALAGAGLATPSRAIDRKMLLGAGGTLLALAATLALFSEANRIALLLLTAVFAADWTTRQFALTAGTARVVFATCCLVPLLLAMILARIV